MTSEKKKASAMLAENIIKKLAGRGIEGFYASNKEAALEIVKSLIQPGMSVAWGGSETLKEIGLLDYLPGSGCCLIDRDQAKNKAEEREIKAKTINADYFLMGSNAITLDGELVNIDGKGNRLSYFVYGPEYVLAVVGMNKITPNVSSAYDRVRNMASPANAIRLGKSTPCGKTGRCGDCMNDDCMCCQIVVTRKSMVKSRIKVILVEEELGF